ncbi:AsmA family protein [Pedobacter hartonius]|uniref:Uncharacterized protein n=1 Tax=Pedobacter hartonius TaxID=425514 RepID=A0A1H3ZE89_9SPHI|nr:hypothetical protein [Pedobacter hartonius]SEA21977.1 hypothetical protein SAMN05443550_102330 [Pedobacter hartonius]
MVNKRPGTRKVWKWIGGIIIVLIAVIASISIYFSIRWKPVLTQKIKDVVYNGSSHLYHINFKDVHLNIVTGSVTVDSILLAPDTAVFNALKKLGTAPTHLFQVKLEKLELRRISILTIYFKRKIEMNDIILEHPSINMIYHKVYKKPTPVKERRSLYERISRTLKSVHIKGVKIEDADFDYVSGATGSVLNSVKNLNVHVKDILIDAHSRTDTGRFYYTKDISFEMAGYHSLSKNKMYTMKVDTITGSAAGKNIHIRGLKMIPMYPEIQFSKMLKTQKDRYNLAFDRIDFNGVNFYRLNIRGVLHARSLRIKNGDAKVFMNREMPPGHGDKTRNFPHMALRRLPIETTIDTLKLRGVNVAYTEYNPISQEKGTVHIDRLNGNIFNVTNDSASLSRNRYAVAELNAYMIRAAQLNIRINFDLLAENAAFTFKGNIGKMDMVKLNPLAKSLGLVKVKSGQIQKIDFDVRANAKGSRGTMHMYYNNLKIELLKEGEDGQPAKKKGLLSFLANTLVVKDENPAKGKPVRTADIVFERPPGASFFNLLWKSVFIGLRETVGLGIIPMKTPEEGRKVVVEKLEERKEKRESRKEKRQQRRAERKAEKEHN